MSKKEQRVFTQELKREAVQLAETSGKSMTQMARDWGISESALHAWRKQLAAHGNQAFPGKGHQTELEEEKRRLRRENDLLKQEREVVKKAVRIFAHSQLWNCTSFKLIVGSIPLRWCAVPWRCRDRWLSRLEQAGSLQTSTRRSGARRAKRTDLPSEPRGLWESTHSCGVARARQTMWLPPHRSFDARAGDQRTTQTPAREGHREQSQPSCGSPSAQPRVERFGSKYQMGHRHHGHWNSRRRSLVFLEWSISPLVWQSGGLWAIGAMSNWEPLRWWWLWADDDHIQVCCITAIVAAKTPVKDIWLFWAALVWKSAWAKKLIVTRMRWWRAFLDQSKRNACIGIPNVPDPRLDKPFSRISRCFPIAPVAIGRWVKSVQLFTSRKQKKMLKQTLDVVRLLWYN